jgi:DNA (cytosine-5)-methyltransferase 1
MVGYDLFAGAGGMSLGAALAGINVALAVEIDPHAAKTYSANHPGTTVFNGDIRRLTTASLKNLQSKKGQTIVFGGPPCQGFSYSNQRTRSADNPDSWLFTHFLRVVRVLRPDWVVFENVQGIVNTAEGMFVTEVVRRLEKTLKYRVSFGLLNALDYGVPQDRTRFFLVGSRDGVQFTLPPASVRKHLTVHDAIGDLPQLSNGAAVSWMPYRSPSPSRFAGAMRGRLGKSPNHLVTRNSPTVIKRYAHIPQGGNWEDIPARLMKNYRDRSRCHTGIYHRLQYEVPSVVIGNYRKNMLIHPEQDRGLSVREAARIQSFPDWYEFHGSIGFQQQQVANAVPPLLAKAVFSAILQMT